MKKHRVTTLVRPVASRDRAALSMPTALGLLAALLLCGSVACSNGNGSDDASPAPSAATSGSTSGSSTAGTTTPPSGGSSTPTSTPQANQAPPRAYSMSFLPSSSGSVDGYEVSLGESTGSYDTVVDIPLNAIATSGSVWTYDLTLDSDRDYFIVLRAYNAGGMSADSNEIRVDALVSGAIGSGGVSTAQASLASTPQSSSIERSTTDTGDAIGDRAAQELAADAKGDADAEEQKHERDRATSLDFDGAGEHLASSQSLELGASYAFSVSIWARPAVDDAARRTLLDLRETAGDANRLTVAVVDSTSIELSLHGADGVLLHRARFEEALLDGEWQHVAVVFDGGIDLEPRLYLDAQRMLASESTSAEGTWSMSDSARRVVIGADASGEGDSWRGQLGHAGMWSTALPDEVIQEVSMGGHAADLRSTGVASNAPEKLMHYWRLGADAQGIGFDHGSALAPLDLDDASGGIDVADVVEEAPAMLQLAAR